MPAIPAILVGYLVWTCIWLAANAGLSAAFSEASKAFEAGGDLTDTAYLAAALAVSVCASLATGAVAARMADERRTVALIGITLLLLLSGAAIQKAVWTRMPLWYHITFLTLLALVPALGARLLGGAPPTSTPEQGT